MNAKRISYFLSLIFCLGLPPVVSAEIYRCQGGQEEQAVFTDNKFSCPQNTAILLAVKPQVLRIERKVLGFIPDLSQRDPNAGFPDDGRKYCAPVAVSNSLSSALGGMPSTQKFEQQVELARTLGSADYMATDAKGTNPVQLLQGVDHYLVDQNIPSYHTERLEYRGQRSVPRKYNPTLDKQAELPWLIEGIKHEKHIWLNVGWYQTQANGKQKRIGGHWVTLVGYEKLGNLKDGEGEYLIVNDPATIDGSKHEQLKVKLGRLNGRKGYQLLDQRSKPRSADIAWVEGAVQLAL